MTTKDQSVHPGPAKPDSITVRLRRPGEQFRPEPAAPPYHVRAFRALGEPGVARYEVSHGRYGTRGGGSWLSIGDFDTSQEAYDAAKARGDAPVYGICPTDFPKVLFDRDEYSQVWSRESGQ